MSGAMVLAVYYSKFASDETAERDGFRRSRGCHLD